MCDFCPTLFQATKFDIKYLHFPGPEEHIPGRRAVTDLIDGANFSSRAFSFSKVSVLYESSSTNTVVWMRRGRRIQLLAVKMSSHSLSSPISYGTSDST